MKKRLLSRLTLIIFGFFLLNSCEEELNIEGIPTEEKAVAIFVGENGEVSFKEGESNVGIVVARNFVDQSVVSVQYSIEELSAEQGVDFVFQSQSGTVDIPSGKASAPILFDFPDNDEATDTRQFRITLNSASSGYILDESPKRVTSVLVNIIDDDCPLILEEFVGEYIALENGNIEYDVTIEVNDDNTALLINNFFDTGGVNTLYLDNSDPSNPIASFVNGEFVFEHPTYGDAAVYNNVNGYISTFSTCTKELVLYFHVCVSAGCFTGFDGNNNQIVLTKK